MSSQCPTCATSSDEGTSHPFWDRLGIGLSVACLIHCLTLPLIASGLAVWAAVDMHLWLALLIVPVAAFVAWSAHRTHRHRWVGPLLLLGSAIIVGTIFLHPYTNAWTEAAINMTGGSLLVAGHWIHYRATRSARQDKPVCADA
jgi:uncharacterized membrane protein YgdD (TMEM256/DUF423 family)